MSFAEDYPIDTQGCRVFGRPGVVQLAIQEIEEGVCHVCGIVVAPALRGQGEGSAIIRWLQSPYSTITANVLFSERQNLAFWRSLGFMPAEVNVEEGYIQVKWSAE